MPQLTERLALHRRRASCWRRLGWVNCPPSFN